MTTWPQDQLYLLWELIHHFGQLPCFRDKILRMVFTVVNFPNYSLAVRQVLSLYRLRLYLM